MYETHFGFRRRPFRSTPDSESYYPATTHERALARIQQAIRDDEGLMLLTGGPGTGKTLLCQALLDRLGPETVSVFLTNSHVGNRLGLFQAILYDLSLPYGGSNEQTLRLTLTDCLLENYGAGKRAVLLIDEAQNLSADLLEELRLLGNLESRQGKAVHVILCAQPAIWETISLPELASFRQRLAIRAELEPLGLHEAADYLMHQVRLAGGRPECLFTDEALEILARASQGIPRLLNQAGHQSFSLAFESEAPLVDAEIALEALGRLGLEPPTLCDEPAFPVVAESDSDEPEVPAAASLTVPEGAIPLLHLETTADCPPSHACHAFDMATPLQSMVMPPRPA